MTNKDFLKNVNSFLVGKNMANTTQEIGFTWQGCECCNNGLGGDKAVAVDINTNKEYMICGDCVFYIEYGDLPNE